MKRTWRDWMHLPSTDEQFRLFSTRRSPLFAALLFFVWEYPFTRAGKLLIGGIVLASLAGAVTVDAPVYQLATALMALAVVTSAVGSVFRWGRITLSGRLPERVAAGETLRGEFTLTNIGRLPLYDLSLECFHPPGSWETLLEPIVLPYLGRGQSDRLSIQMTLRRRGVYRLPPIRAFTTFPFNLYRNEVARCSAGSVLVLPRFHPMSRIELDVGNRYQPGGIALTSHVGESAEFIGNRDYVSGDALRRIDFRSWARLARPVVKEYHEEYYCRIALVLDTFVATRRRPPRAGYPQFEAAISLVASVADALSRGEYIIDLFAAGPELHIFRSGRHTAHFENVLDILAGLEHSRSEPFEKLGPALLDELRQISTVVGIFLNWDGQRRQLVQAAVEAGSRVRILIVRDGPTDLPLEPLPGVRMDQYTLAQVEAGIGML